MFKIFKKEFPKAVSFYINTSPFSYFNIEKKYISISMSCNLLYRIYYMRLTTICLENIIKIK